MTSLPPRFLLTVDPSLTCSGWALFSVPAEKLLGVGKIRSLKPELGLKLRLEQFQMQVNSLYNQIALNHQDIVVCEAPTTMRDPKAAFKVEQIRCIFETLARERSSTVPGRLNPRSVQFEVLGLKGKQLVRTIVKSAACHTAKHLYSAALGNIGFADVHRLEKHQDIVDALLLGSLALSRIKQTRISGNPLAAHFAETTSIRTRRAA